MAKLKAFRAVHYNKDIYPDPSVVIAPPYDSIASTEREALMQKSEHSVVHLMHDVKAENNEDITLRYKRARQIVDDWMENGILVQEEQEGFYIYEQTYEIKNHHYVQRGLIALCALEDYENKIILPHDKTSPEPIADRFSLLSNLQMTFGQIHCIFTDPEKQIHAKIKSVTAEAPVIQFTHDSGIHQRLWKVCDKETLAQITAFFANKRLYIADGHHRYEASLLYRDRQRAQNPAWTKEDSSNYALMLLTAIDDPGITIFPTHRFLSKVPMDEASMISFLKDDFQLEKVIVDRFAKELSDAIDFDLESTNDSKIYALYFGGDYYYRIRPRDTHAIDALLPDASPAYRNLEVTVLHKLLLEKHFNLEQADMENPQVISYIPDACAAVERVQNTPESCCVFLKATKVRQIKEVATEGEIMPPHSTYFYPKPFSGLLIYKH